MIKIKDTVPTIKELIEHKVKAGINTVLIVDAIHNELKKYNMTFEYYSREYFKREVGIPINQFIEAKQFEHAVESFESDPNVVIGPRDTYCNVPRFIDKYDAYIANPPRQELRSFFCVLDYAFPPTMYEHYDPYGESDIDNEQASKLMLIIEAKSKDEAIDEYLSFVFDNDLDCIADYIIIEDYLETIKWGDTSEFEAYDTDEIKKITKKIKKQFFVDGDEDVNVEQLIKDPEMGRLLAEFWDSLKKKRDAYKQAAAQNVIAYTTNRPDEYRRILEAKKQKLIPNAQPEAILLINVLIKMIQLEKKESYIINEQSLARIIENTRMRNRILELGIDDICSCIEVRDESRSISIHLFEFLCSRLNEMEIKPSPLLFQLAESKVEFVNQKGRPQLDDLIAKEAERIFSLFE